MVVYLYVFVFFFQAEDGIRDDLVTGVQTCALPISSPDPSGVRPRVGRRGERLAGLPSTPGPTRGLHGGSSPRNRRLPTSSPRDHRSGASPRGSSGPRGTGIEGCRTG